MRRMHGTAMCLFLLSRLCIHQTGTVAQAEEVQQPQSRDAAVSPVDGPIRLFNGQNLDGFYTWIRDSQYDDPKQVYTVQDGMIHVSGDGYGGLITEKAYRDYHLITEFKWGDKTWGDREKAARDSGVLVHGWGPDGGYSNTWMTSIEAQIIEGGIGDILVLSLSLIHISEPTRPY